MANTKLVTDCHTGQTTEVPLSQAEIDALAAVATAAAADTTARATAVSTFQTRLGDVKTQYAASITRLDQIQTQMGSSPTNAQVVAAVGDLALGLERTLKLLAALVQAG